MKLGLAAAFLGATLLAGTASAADKRWDGADDLPVNPLACSAGEASAAPAAKPYDGGQATNPPDKAGKPITLVDVPKLIAKYRREVNPDVMVYLVQVAGYADTLMPEFYDRTFILGGWGEGLLRFAAEMSSVYNHEASGTIRNGVQ